MRKKEQTKRAPTGSTGVKQNVNEQAQDRDKVDSTPPPLRRTSGSPPPSRWEVFFNLFLNNLRRTRDGSFLDNILDSSRLGAVDPHRGGKLNGCGDCCDTGICWSGSAKYW